MADLGAINENVQFNWLAAGEMAGELRSTAALLDGQVGQRRNIGLTTRKQWEGAYAQMFDARSGTCLGDAQRLAEVMRRAAADLDALATMARQEQQRREAAREWVAAQNDGGFLGLGHVAHAIGDFLGGDDLPPPPEIPEPSIPIMMPPPTSRGSAAPDGG